MKALATAAVTAALLLTESATALAQSQSAVTIELNKLEQRDDACRAYLLFQNASQEEYTTFRLDLILFGADGVISRRIAVDASPLRAGKSVVKLFDLADLRCETIARILLNDVAPCGTATGERQDCIEAVTVRSRTEVEFFD